MPSLYDLYTETPPMKNGMRHRGSSSADEYWRGFDGHRSMSPSKDSQSHGAYRAGRDAKKRTGNCDLVYSEDDDATTGKGWYLTLWHDDKPSQSFETEAQARSWAHTNEWDIKAVLQ